MPHGYISFSMCPIGKYNDQHINSASIPHVLIIGQERCIQLTLQHPTAGSHDQLTIDHQVFSTGSHGSLRAHNFINHQLIPAETSMIFNIKPTVMTNNYTHHLTIYLTISLNIN